MRVITDFVRASSLPEALKEELAGAQIMQQHQLYVKLPTWLAPLFGSGVSPAQVEQLGFSSYFYFRFLLAIDHVLDTAPTAASDPQLATVRLLTYCDLFEQSVRGLSTLFGPGDPFWAQLDACKKHYAASNLHEKNFSVARGSFSLEAFESLAQGKSAVCNAVVYALSSLGGVTEPVEPLLDCLKHLHVALQCMDDVDDFRTDWEQGQYTYAHAQVENYLESQGMDPQCFTGAQAHPYLYTSGTADALYAMAQEHFRRAITLVNPFPLADLQALLAHYVTRCVFYRDDIEAKLTRARDQVAGASLAA